MNMENSDMENSDMEMRQTDETSRDIIYREDKDFYKGMSGELRFKAEGLFKKAKEKGISIEEINVTTLKENLVDFPALGDVSLPAFFVRVTGRNLFSNQVMADGKQIDYYNRYQKYIADRIEWKNIVRDEKGRMIREGGRPKVKDEVEMALSEWEKFEIGRSLVSDKEFGLEKTITGACDRVIRKLMGENDWLYPDEARLLDEEFDNVQNIIMKEQETKKDTVTANIRKATERQINYLKAKIRNLGINPEDKSAIREILRQTGFDAVSVEELSTGDMSRLIDNITSIIPKVKDKMNRMGESLKTGNAEYGQAGKGIRQ